MPQTLKNICNFTLRWLLAFDNISLGQRLRLKTLGYLLFISSIFCLLLGFPMANFWLLLMKQSFSSNVNHCIWGTYFGPKLNGWGWSLHLIECPLSFDHNAITHLATHPKLQKILSQDLHPVLQKCGNAPNAQKSYSLKLWWPLGLHNTSLDVKLRAQNFRFCW